LGGPDLEQPVSQAQKSAAAGAAALSEKSTMRPATSPGEQGTPMSTGNHITVSKPHPQSTQRLIRITNALADAYAASLAYARQKHGEAVKPEDVRTFLVTAFINATGGR
jgi:hypothetical protein